MTRCPDVCGKKWRMRQIKPGWQKQKEFRKLTIEKEMKITRIIEEKEEEE